MNRHAKDLHAPGKPPLIAGATPLIERRDHVAPSVFRPESLLREARRQKGLAPGSVPAVCVLDPDGDIVAHVRRHGAEPCRRWACYHSAMWTWRAGDLACGIIGHVVGGSFAVLVAEQLFASGCELLINVTSAGQITDVGPPPYYILVERALRDEGTSYHYLPPSNYVAADPALIALAAEAAARAGRHVHVGDSWTTDAPFRETAEAIEAARSKGALAVEMEAAALYCFARTAGVPVLCLAHVTNTMGQAERDFEKGEADGTADALSVLEAIVGAATARRPAT